MFEIFLSFFHFFSVNLRLDLGEHDLLLTACGWVRQFFSWLWLGVGGCDLFFGLVCYNIVLAGCRWVV